jgi:transposase InsO family protein
LKRAYGTTTVLRVLELNRSGYYKWIKRKDITPQYVLDRIDLTQRLKQAHQKHKTYGYRNLAKTIRNQTGWVFSDHLAHVCAKAAGIRSKARKPKSVQPGSEHEVFKNEVQGFWRASKPLEIVVSDMTVLRNHGTSWEWTYILDTFNNEIIASSLSSKRGDIKPYFDTLEQLKTKIKGADHPVILHTDQGAVYSSRAYQQAHENYNIVRSMSRSGTPTDNPIIEAINGWIKDELYYDYNYHKTDDLPKLINDYITYFNNDRLAYALNYKTPIQYKRDLGFE